MSSSTNHKLEVRLIIEQTKLFFISLSKDKSKWEISITENTADYLESLLEYYEQEFGEEYES